jgi:hypothetical protein
MHLAIAALRPGSRGAQIFALRNKLGMAISIATNSS